MISYLCEYVIQYLPDSIAPKFVGELPSLSDEGVAVMLSDGDINTMYFGMPETIIRPILKFVIRTKEYSKGAMWSQLLKDTFNRFSTDKIDGMYFSGSILYLGRNEEKLHEFQLIFETIVKE